MTVASDVGIRKTEQETLELTPKRNKRVEGSWCHWGRGGGASENTLRPEVEERPG